MAKCTPVDCNADVVSCGSRQQRAEGQTASNKVRITFRREETNMSELRYPNESKEYRDARDSLLKDEQELIDKVKSVAEKRRKLPLGGRVERGLRFPMGQRWESREEREILRAVWGTRTPCCFTRSCSVRAGTTPVLPARRWSMGLIGPGIRSPDTPRLSQLPKPRPIESMRGPKQRGWSQIALVSGFDSPLSGRLQMPGRVR